MGSIVCIGLCQIFRIFMIVSPINVETTFCVLKFFISLLKLKSNDLIPFFGAI